MKKIILLYLLFYFSLACSQTIQLKTEFQQSYPKYFIDKHQNISGLCIDIMSAITTYAPEIKIIAPKNQFTPFKRIQQNLEDGKTDVFFGLAKNKQRLKKYTFIKIPIYELKHIIAVRKNDPVEISSFNDIINLGSQGKILTIFGTATYQFLSKQKDLILDARGRNININLNKLLAHRGRFVYFHDLGLISTINKNRKFKKEIKVLPISFRKYYHYIAFSKKVPQLIVNKITMIIQTLTENGELNKIVSQYNAIK